MDDKSNKSEKKKKDSTEELRISFDSSLSFEQSVKDECGKVVERGKRYAPYTKKTRRYVPPFQHHVVK